MTIQTMEETPKSVVAVAVNAGPATRTKPAKTLKSQLLGGRLTLLAGSGLVGVTNLLYNVVTARLLGPTGFAHATAVYTILMLLSCITLAFQVVWGRGGWGEGGWRWLGACGGGGGWGEGALVCFCFCSGGE